MELYKEILIQVLLDGQLSFQGWEPEISKIVEGECYNALQKIKAVIWDDSLEDKECFMRIEEIVRVLEETGSSGGNRHDFG